MALEAVCQVIIGWTKQPCGKINAGELNPRLRKDADLCPEHREALAKYGDAGKMCVCGHHLIMHHMAPYMGYRGRRCAKKHKDNTYACACVKFQGRQRANRQD